MENVAGDCNKYRKQVFLSDILTFTGTMSIDRAIDQWRHRLDCVVQQQEGYIEHYVKTAGCDSYFR